MQDRSLIQMFVGKWNTLTLVSVAVGAALFGVLMVYASFPVFMNTFASAAMIVPVVVGGLFGPLPAFVTMAVGNFLADVIGGWGIWIDWSIGNGTLGLFIGALPLYGARIDEGIFTVKHAVIFAVCCIVGNVVAFGLVTPIFTRIFYAQSLDISLLQALPAGVSNTIILTVVGIPLLFLLAKRYKSRSDLKEED